MSFYFQPVDQFHQEQMNGNYSEITPKLLEFLLYRYYLYGVHLLTAPEREKDRYQNLLKHYSNYEEILLKLQPANDQPVLSYVWEGEYLRYRKFSYLFSMTKTLSNDHVPAYKVLTTDDNLQTFLRLHRGYKKERISFELDTRAVLFSAENFTLKSVTSTRNLWSLEIYGMQAVAALDALQTDTQSLMSDSFVFSSGNDLAIGKARAQLTEYLHQFPLKWVDLASSDDEQ